MTHNLERIGEIVCRIGALPGIAPDEDFYEAGFSSVRALELLFELETAYNVSIPDDDFIGTRCIRGLQEMICRLTEEQVG